ncbi:MAG: crotonobetainyl-CoA--carnitine CoA-transferase [Patescibacteria group bacterium]
MNHERIARTFIHMSEGEKIHNQELVVLFKHAPIPEDEIIANLGLFLGRKNLTRILWMDELYQKIVTVPGVIMEFGCRWGHNLALFGAFRSMYEPYNYSRKIIGFDTFSGFRPLHEKDASEARLKSGDYSVTRGYEQYLEKLLALHEQEAPIAHIKKFELIKGDAPEQLERYLKDHPETIISLAYFDMDMYEPTKECLELIRSKVTKGSIIGFDELASTVFPGETTALAEVFGLDKCRITRDPKNSLPSYLVIE